MNIEKGQFKKHEDKKSVEGRERSRDAVGIISEKMKEVDTAVEDLVVSGQKKIDDAGRKLRLPDSILDSVWREVDMPRRQEEIAREADIFSHRAKDALLDTVLDLPEKPDNKPIKKGEVFSPEEELRKILKASRAERPKLLKEYKEKLAYQKEGLAQMQEDIFNEIRKDPNATLGHFYQWVRDYGETHGLTGEQKVIARELLRAYEDKHKAVRANREKYPDDGELFKAVFGQEPRGRVTVVEGPVTLYFRCMDPDDYVLIVSQSFLVNREASHEERGKALKSYGVSIGTSLIPELRGTIIAENSSALKQGNKGILEHEEQHAIKKLFEGKIKEQNGWERVFLADNAEERLLAVRNFLRLYREDKADERAKDEILAYFVGQNYSVDKVVEILTKPKEQGGLYDYLSGAQETHVKLFVNKFGLEFQDIAKKEAESIFVKEYRDLIKKGALAVESLGWSGYSEQQIIAILIQEPLAKWEKVVKRLLEDRK